LSSMSSMLTIHGDGSIDARDSPHSPGFTCNADNLFVPVASSSSLGYLGRLIQLHRNNTGSFQDGELGHDPDVYLVHILLLILPRAPLEITTLQPQVSPRSHDPPTRQPNF
jgi:hypothetical protein